MRSNMPSNTPSNTPEPSSPPQPNARHQEKPRGAERRKDKRLYDTLKQLHFIFDGCTMVTVNWSTGGCMVKAAAGMKAGDTVTGALETREGVPISIISAGIMRIDDRGYAALKFIQFDSLL